MEKIIFVISLLFFSESALAADVNFINRNFSYNSIYRAYHKSKLKCSDSEPFVVIEFDESNWKSHKKGDIFYLISHSGDIIEAALDRPPADDPKCQTIREETFGEKVLTHYFGTLKKKGSLEWYDADNCGDDFIMAVKGKKPQKSDIGAVFQFKDNFKTPVQKEPGDDASTIEWALKARPLMKEIIKKDSQLSAYYGGSLTSVAYRIVAPDKKHEYLFVNLIGPADQGDNFEFEIKNSKLELLRHNPVYRCISNVSNFDRGDTFEILEGFHPNRLETEERLVKFGGSTLKEFRHIIGD